MPRTLHDQMTRESRETLALLLGFPTDCVRNAYGFRINLQEIPALPDGWTNGDALRAYGEFLIRLADRA